MIDGVKYLRIAVTQTEHGPMRYIVLIGARALSARLLQSGAMCATSAAAAERVRNARSFRGVRAMNPERTGMCDTKRDSAGCSATNREIRRCVARNRDAGAAGAGSALAGATFRNLLGICVATNREPLTFPTLEGVALP